MKKSIFVVLLLALLPLAGCTEIGPEEGVSFAFLMFTEDASRVDEGQGGCGEGSDVECHSVTIFAKNSGDIDISTDKALWKATSDNGTQTWSAFSVTGPEVISADGETNLTVHFEVTNGITLSSIEWSDNVEQFGEVSSTSRIEAYD